VPSGRGQLKTRFSGKPVIPARSPRRARAVRLSR
jgi:hypothetical protein